MTDQTEQPVRLRFFCESASDVEWEVSGLELSERFNEPYQLRLELRTQDPHAEAIAMLGASVVVTVERGSLQRELCGIVESVEDGTNQADHVVATLTVVPALVALGHRKTSRIFQDMTIPDILAAVLSEGLDPYERSVNTDFLTGDYSPQEYTVQYRETDLDFVDRLMEEYGIVYCFKHADTEILTLIDDPSGYEDLISHGNDDGVLPVVLRGDGAGMGENIHAFRRESKLRPSVARTAVYDWLAPGPAQLVENDTVSDLGFANGAELGPEREDYEHEEPSTLYGYRTEGLDTAAVESQVRLRRVVHQRDATRSIGMSTATGLSPGMKFELLDHPTPNLDGQYLVISVEHNAGNYMRTDAEGSAQDSYNNRFECVPIDLEWRPARRTPRPRIHSMQTATVVGPAGEEIHTDEHGRIKVQFHWDRGGESDENASCFIRVVQPWAGNGWGFVFLPRIGMEVTVTFLDGDPDRPMVTGCVYNGANATPYPLPDDKTKSTIKSASSPGGGGFNELRLEDAAGSEEIYIHAQKDFNEVVLNDHNTTVGNNQTNNVDVDQTQTVHGNQSETVDGNQDMTVGGNRTVHVVGDFEETVDATETRTVTGDVTETFAASETRDIAADQTETIGGSVTHTITGGVTDKITGSLSQTIVGGVSVTTPATYDVTAAAGVTITSGAAMKLVAPAGLTMVAPGGTTTVDSFFESIGGKDSDLFAWKTSVLSGKLDMVYLAIGLVNNKVDVVGLKVDVAGSVFKAGRQTTIESLGAAIQQGYVNLKLFGFVSVV
ncbi:type VI secretion system Vgr family protein [Enhygromyxa salina]|uniref:Phage-related baseplate assembly protein n=1 Tax=Enhygromyxa salina TaxID=215803 RepID=A0A2S9YYW1_9BACT|nr:type VI secretion system tip protein TssI/VgrG [Enhygromyxa salina]PRQ10249.1 Phage-related baseplate assembly protein [Enhygromyxa salina]